MKEHGHNANGGPLLIFAPESFEWVNTALLFILLLFLS